MGFATFRGFILAVICVRFGLVILGLVGFQGLRSVAFRVGLGF